MANRFPLRSEGPLDLPDGTKVWLKTLNSNQKGIVSEEANKAGKLASAQVRKGGKQHAATLIEIKSLSEEERAEYIAEQPLKSGLFDSQAEDAFPDPPYPERETNEDDAAYAKKLEGYDKARDKIITKRDEKVKALYESLKADALSKTSKERLDWCLNTSINENFMTAFSRAYNYHVMYFATRTFEDHTEFYFGDDMERGARLIADIDDDARSAIIKKYNELDSMKTREIPTPPDNS